jgi:hypothetical protein
MSRFPCEVVALALTPHLAAHKSQLDPETQPTERTLVVGSLFGGMIFTLENGLVTAIFVGAAAE